MNFIISLVINAVILLIAAYILPRVEIRNFGTALVVALLIGILNPTVGWILRAVLSLATLFLVGFLVRLIVTAIIIKLVDALVGGFKVHGFGTAIILAIVVALIGTLTDWMLGS